MILKCEFCKIFRHYDYPLEIEGVEPFYPIAKMEACEGCHEDAKEFLLEKHK